MRSYGLPLLFVSGIVGFIAGTVVVERTAINRLLELDAVAEAQAWTDFLAGNLTSLPQFVEQGKVSPETASFIERVKPASHIFLFKVYDHTGRLIFYSDDNPVTEADRANLLQHNPEAAEAIASGWPLVEARTGKPPTRPEYYSEAYVPLRDGSGAVVGVVESYVDQAEKRIHFQGAFAVSTVALSILVALAFGLPAIGWYRRQREQERSAERIRFLSSHDALIGTLNRSAAVERLEEMLGSDSVRTVHLAIHKIDVDHFRDINNSIGLEGGDFFLKAFAERLTSLARQNDIIARLGADEFMVIQTDLAGAEGAGAFGRTIIREMARPFRVEEQDIVTSVCIGTAVAPEHGRNAERLMRSAKLALGHAKMLGPGNQHSFSAELDTAMERRLKVERAIARAIAAKGFEVHYQPLYSAGGLLVGFEALARLPDKDGFISPAEFIPAAERMGVIDQVGAFMIEAACSAATTWPEALGVSVNLSPAQFHGSGVTGTIADVLARTGLAPHRLLLEITESLLLEDRDHVTAQLRELKRMGTAIVMDDFGTGYSSLSYLWRFPFDKIKIDASFMRGIADGEKTASKVVQSITLLGQALGLRVCVEGVETEEQAETARALGCDEVQGFYFARPAPLADVAGIVLQDFRHRIGKVAEAARSPGRTAEKKAMG